ncbi:MAG: PAS domain-containing protein [Ruminococcaceae bacterium]|nr:PAS domain-containing protein [Oscillospiraceae bacterium]
MPNTVTAINENCKNCHRCIRQCPVKAICFTDNRAHTIWEDCVLCGRCFLVCPQHAKRISNETEKVKGFLKAGYKVVASLDPSFVAKFENVSMDGMRQGLRTLGFFDAEDASLGATIVKREYERILKEEKPDILITSSCHSVNLLVQKYYPQLLPYLANVVSPMEAHCQDIKRRHPEVKTVYISPCVSKRDEAEQCLSVDAVLTFKELSKWMLAESILLEKTTEENNKKICRAGMFPVVGGIIKSMDVLPDYEYIAIDGMKSCISALKDIEAGDIHKCFFEMSSCFGGCVGGPLLDHYYHSSIKEHIAVCRRVGEFDCDVVQPPVQSVRKDFLAIHRNVAEPTEEEITEILNKMGKFKRSDELNCGFCGYHSCREKATAVYLGKAETSMCLPFLKDKAESFSHSIVKHTPNGIIVLNEGLIIREINDAARNILKITDVESVLNQYIGNYLEAEPFKEVLTTKENLRERRMFLEKYDCFVDQTIVYVQDSQRLICILRDVTNEEEKRIKMENISQETIMVTDRIVASQMRIVQDIASLLGETAAQTKIELAKLKESMSDD